MVIMLKKFVKRHKKYAPVAFFVGGFLWDSLTLGRVDTLYSNLVLCGYLVLLSVSLYLYNLADDGRWKDTFLEAYEEYFPLAIQFFLGGLCSAYVIFYSRSVSFTKTLSFFVILVVLLFANEILKHRISNKYLQFGAYFFVNFTFFTFFLPILFNAMNTFLFFLSGLASLATTLYLIRFIYRKSPSTRKEITRGRLVSLIIVIYLAINTFYYFNLIPPVPLSLEKGIVAHDVEKEEQFFEVTYEKGDWYQFWRPYSRIFSYQPGDTVFVFTSIFAPADLQKSVYHHWQWYSPFADGWQTTDRIGYEITGGRRGGYRGHTYKQKLMAGQWRVDVITEEGLILGSVEFTIPEDSTLNPPVLTHRIF